MEKRVTVGLFGINGLYNFGCEAIVRGTYRLIKEALPNSRVVFYTFSVAHDRPIVSDLDIDVKPVPVLRFQFPRRATNKVLQLLSLDTRLPFRDPRPVIEECDIVFSVGGDIYTIPEYSIKRGTEIPFNHLVEFGRVIVRHRPMVVWGASIGPFGEKRKVKDYFFDHLKDMKVIFCREKRTYDYLQTNGLENVYMAPDPAFYVLEENRKITTSKKSTRTIGLNLSPLSVVETQGTTSVSFTGSVVSLIKELCAIPRTEVLLIPHVVSPFSQNDNDLFFLEKIYDSLPSPLRDRVKIVDNKGYLGTKAFLRQCDVVVAARMHCAINAVCEGVPTIFLSYSQKAKGMAEFVYGSDHWVVPLNKMLQGVPLLVHEMLEKHQSIVSLLNSRLEDIKRERSAAVTEIKALLCDSSIRNRTNS